jgi:hypothetical protein
MRGVDDKNRLYLLFFYKNHKTGQIYYEFIYNTYLYRNSLPINIFTYSGYNSNCYIGNLSFFADDDIILNNINALNPRRYFKRELIEDSYTYIEKLINYEPCGEVIYDETYEEYIESDNTKYNNTDSTVTLFFDKEEIENQIKHNFYVNQYSIHKY